MITFLASYPRSGNTMYRCILRELGFDSYSIYPDENEPGINKKKPGSFLSMKVSDSHYFVKTHELPDGETPAIYIARDGRDTLVSFARMKEKNEGADFLEALSALVKSGAWGKHVIAWLKAPNRITTVQYENLVQSVCLNNFGIMKETEPRFFRRGIVGSYQDEMPKEIEDEFWGNHDNREAMNLLGYTQ